MALRSKTRIKKSASSGKFVLGRERFAKISAVEGIKLTSAMKKRSKDFDREGLTAAERRRAIIKTYRKA